MTTGSCVEGGFEMAGRPSCRRCRCRPALRRPGRRLCHHLRPRPRRQRRLRCPRRHPCRPLLPRRPSSFRRSPRRPSRRRPTHRIHRFQGSYRTLPRSCPPSSRRGRRFRRRAARRPAPSPPRPRCRSRRRPHPRRRRSCKRRWPERRGRCRRPRELAMGSAGTAPMLGAAAWIRTSLPWTYLCDG
jgi:hypothetical protein